MHTNTDRHINIQTHSLARRYTFTLGHLDTHRHKHTDTNTHALKTAQITSYILKDFYISRIKE